MLKRALLASLFALAFSMHARAAQNDADVKEALVKSFALIDSYTKDLHPQHDPFALVFELEEGQSLFARLKKDRPLEKVMDALCVYRTQSTVYDAEMVRGVLEQAEKTLKEKSPREAKQSNLLALQYLVDYLRRFVPPEEMPADSNTPVREQKSEEEKPEEEKSKDKTPQKQPKSYPRMPMDYTPSTKDTEKNKQAAKQEEQYIVVETDFATPYFGQRYYNEIVRGQPKPFKEIPLPGTTQSPGQAEDTRHHMWIQTYGESSVTLFLPPGHKPYQPVDPHARIEANNTGTFTLTLNKDLAAKHPGGIQIPLQERATAQLPPPAQEVYVRKVGFERAEWPAKIQTLLNTISQNEDTRNIAKAISHHLATQYLYSVGPRDESDPIAALNAGSFQCDMAAYVMVALLRDQFKIPSRVVAGYRAKKFKTGADGKSYLVQPGEAHAWIEIHTDGEWVPFDPTPIKKDRKSKEEDGEKDEYSDRVPDDQPQVDDDNEDKEDLVANDNNTTKALSDQIKEDSKQRLDETRKDSLEPDANDDNDPVNRMDERELARKLELGSLSLKPEQSKSPLDDRAKRVLLRRVLNPREDGLSVQKRLNLMAPNFRGIENKDAQNLFMDAMAAHKRAHEPFADWLLQISASINVNDIPKTYHDLFWATRTLELYMKLVDDENVLEQGHALLRNLKDLVQELEGYADKDSPNISMVDAFHRSLPSLAQKLLRADYNLTNVGNNTPTHLVAKALITHELDALRLVSELMPVSDFILRSVAMPEYEEVMTFRRDPKKPVGRDLMPLQRFTEMSKAMFTQIGKSPEQNIMEHTAFVPTTRERILVPTGNGNEDAQRITIVLYDTSGSMAGDFEHFQGALISAFTARALSDLSPSGKHRHKVVLLPFDDKTGDPYPVVDAAAAIDVLRNYKMKLRNTGGGTDIQGALIQAFALIADAQIRNNNEPLALANILLMTDGEAELDLPALIAARNAKIDPLTRVQTMFAAIGNTNQKLIQFADLSQDAGVGLGKTYYREFSKSVIEEYLAKAKRPPEPGAEGQIYSDRKPSELPFAFTNSLSRAANAARILVDTNGVRGDDFFVRSEDHLKSYESQRWPVIKDIARPLGDWINQVRCFGHASIFKKERRLFEIVVHDIMTNFEKITGVSLDALSQTEISSLRWFLNEAAGKKYTPDAMGK